MTEKRSPEQQLEDVLSGIRKDGDPRIAEALELTRKLVEQSAIRQARIVLEVHNRTKHGKR